MLTPEMLSAMTDQQRGELYDKMAKTYYARDAYQIKLADDFGISRATAYRYAQDGAPFAVLFTLDACLDTGNAAMRELQELPTQLAAAAHAMSLAAGTMTRAARRLVKIDPSPQESSKPAAEEL